MIPRRIATTAVAVALGVATMTMTAQPAQATWPGSNGTIYFVCRVIGGNGYSGQDICRINPDGSGLVNLTNTPTQTENTPEVKKDGTKVSFMRGEHVWVMNPDGTGQQQVTTVPSDGGSWTPDGRIAFRAETAPSTYEFRTVAATGGATTFLHAAAGSYSPPRFTSDGRWLYGKFAPVSPGSGTSSNQVFVVDGASEQQVTTSSPTLSSNDFPSWAPGGGSIVYQRMSSGQSDLYLVPSAGGTEVRLTTTAAPVDENWAQLSPDGTRMVFHQEDADHDFFHVRLMIANADASGRTELLTPGYDYAGFAVWAPAVGSTPTTASFNADAPASVKGAKKVKVTLRCLGEAACKVTYGAKLKVPAYGKVKKQTFTIPSVVVSQSGRTSKTVKLKLAKPAKKALKAALAAGKKPKYKVSVTARRTTGQLIRSQTMTVKVTS